MAAVTATKKYATSFNGQYNRWAVTITPTSASDTFTLTQADHGVNPNGTITVESALITTGADANLQTAHPTVSGATVTVVTKGADGLAATDWTGASITISGTATM